MNKEVTALKLKNTWDIVKRPENVNVVDCRWVYKIKYSPDRSEAKLKSRVVAKGFTQEYGVDFFETYAPVVKNSSVRLLMAVAVIKQMIVEQIDIKNAYVNSELEEVVYMEQPQGFEEGDKRELVCKLNKSLYGLKQSGNKWNKCLNEILTKKLGFRRLKTESCIYVKGSGKELVILAVYVDDILIFASDKNIISEIKSKIKDEFEIDDIGQCKKVIGMNIKCGEDGIEIDQKQLIEEILKENNMCGAKISKTPLNNFEKLVRCKDTKDKEDCGKIDGKEYRSVVGKLNYLASTTRPDLTFSVSYLSQFNQCPHPEHMSAVQTVLRYLAGTSDRGIKYSSEKVDTKLIGFVDADWAQCTIDRRSYTGCVMMLSGGPVSWESKKQPTVALSSTEAEYMAFTCAAKEIVFLKSILTELDLEEICGKEITLNSDNQSAIQLAENNGYSPRTKHIDVRHHYIRDLTEAKVVKMKYINTGDNLADIFTKPLKRILHWKAAEELIKGI